MIKHKEKNFISVIVYIHNHEYYVEEFFAGIVDLLELYFEKFEIIFVNDESKDGSKQTIKQLSSNYNNLTLSIIDLSFYHGLETAILAGVDIAIGDFIFEFDSPIVDYSFYEVMSIYNKALEGYDIVSASPDKKEKMFSHIFYQLFQRFSSNNLRLYSETFRVLSRRAVNRVNILNEHIPYRKAIYFNCGLKAVNLRYVPQKRKDVINSNRFREKSQLAINALIIFTDLSSKISIIMAFLMLIFSIGVGIYTAITFFTYRNVVEGWTTTMLFLSFAFTGLFSLIALLIKYLSMLLNFHFKKQSYVLESIEKI